jgi:hypothetical protein
MPSCESISSWSRCSRLIVTFASSISGYANYKLQSDLNSFHLCQSGKPGVENLHKAGIAARAIHIAVAIILPR